MKRIILLVLLVSAAGLSLQGCAALAVTPLMGSALGGGAGAVGKAGTEHLANGTVVRTFVEPMDKVHTAVTDTLRRLEIRLEEDGVTADGGKLVGEAGDSHVQVKLEPLTPTLTRMSLRVKRGHFGRDRATASEIVSQIEKVLPERPLAAAARRSARAR